MPVDRDDFWELPWSGKVRDFGRQLEKNFALTGTTDYYTALARTANNTPNSEGTLDRIDIQLDPDQHVEGLWFARVLYGIEGSDGGGTEPTDIGDEKTRYSTAGGSVRVYQALEHVASYGVDSADYPTPDHGGAINVTPEKVEGVEIEVPGWTMVITKIFAADVVNTDFLRAIYRATKKTNASAWRGFEAGELWLKGVELEERDSESYRAVYEFVASENLEDQTVGTITGVDKAGHDYAWSEHGIRPDPTAVVNERELIAVHIERVYDSAEFSTLGLGA